MLSILLINDNKIVSRLLQLSSKKSGFDIEESGVFSPSKDSYNLVFIDSDKYSEELMDKIKENLTYDKLVFIGTAQVKKPEEFELVLEKPFLPTDFISLVEKNFIVENKEAEEIIDFDKDEDIGSIEEETSDEELKLDENLDELDNSVENLAQMVDEIDEVDSDKDDLEGEEELDLDIEELEEFDLNEELLSDDEEKSKEEVEDEEELPDIEEEINDSSESDEKEKDENAELSINEEIEETEDIDEINENHEDIEDSKDTEDIEEETDDDGEILDFSSIDQTEMKQLIEPDEEIDSEEAEIKEENEELESTTDSKDKDEVISKNLDLDIEVIESIIEKKLKEIVTPKLIQDALKGLSISFEEKE